MQREGSAPSKSLPSRIVHLIHTRSLWQIGIAYLGGAWAVLSHIDLLVARFGLPEVVFGVSAAFVGIGFLGVLALAAVARVQVAWKRALIWAVAYVLVVFLLTEVIATLVEHMGWAVPLIVLLALALLVPGSLGLWLWRRRSAIPDERSIS